MKFISIRYAIVKYVTGKVKEPCENHDLGKLLFKILCNVFIMLHINEQNAMVVSHSKWTELHQTHTLYKYTVY